MHSSKACFNCKKQTVCSVYKEFKEFRDYYNAINASSLSLNECLVVIADFCIVWENID